MFAMYVNYRPTTVYRYHDIFQISYRYRIEIAKVISTHLYCEEIFGANMYLLVY